MNKKIWWIVAAVIVVIAVIAVIVKGRNRTNLATLRFHALTSQRRWERIRRRLQWRWPQS